MSTDTELQVRSSQQENAIRPITPMDMLQIAVSQDADLDKLQKLMDLNDRWQAAEARKAFVAAMAAFKREPIVLIKDKENRQYSSKELGGPKAMYTSLGNMVNTVTPFLSKHGLSARWDVKQHTIITITCIITHTQGHSEQVSMDLPIDSSGAKNPIQAIKSSITYGKACTFESICGLASTDANVDDDGNGAGKQKPTIAEERRSEWIDGINSTRNMDELHRTYKEAYVEAQKLGDQATMRIYTQVKDEKKKEFAK